MSFLNWRTILTKQCAVLRFLVSETAVDHVAHPPVVVVVDVVVVIVAVVVVIVAVVVVVVVVAVIIVVVVVHMYVLYISCLFFYNWFSGG